MRVTRTHSSSTSVDLEKEYPEFWAKYLEDVIPLWVNFHDYWFDVANKKALPVYFIRYEDLINNPY